VISIPAGLMHMPFGRFVLFTALGSAIWNAILVGVGLWLGTTFDKVEHLVAPVLIVGAVVMLGLYLWRVLTWKPRAAR
jgi:membrane protein DedA with SNARE-associated domain